MLPLNNQIPFWQRYLALSGEDGKEHSTLHVVVVEVVLVVLVVVVPVQGTEIVWQASLPGTETVPQKHDDGLHSSSS